MSGSGFIKKAASMAGKGVEKTFDTLGQGTMKAAFGTAKTGHKAVNGMFRNATEKEMKDSGIIGGLINKRLTASGGAALIGGTFLLSTANGVKDNGGLTDMNRLGDVVVGDNLDRLLSYDGSGFVNQYKQISNSSPEIEQEVVQNTFNNVNQIGVSGDLVFALHNLREG